MRKLMNLNEIPVSSNQIVKELAIHLGKTAAWCAVGFVMIQFAKDFAAGYMHAAKNLMKD